MFTLSLDLADGQNLQIPIDFDLDDTTPEQVGLAVSLAGKDPDTLTFTAAMIFARLDRPTEDWEVIGPVLIGLLRGDTSHLVVI